MIISIIFITCDGNVKRVILTNTFYIHLTTPFIVHIVKLSYIIKSIFYKLGVTNIRIDKNNLGC